MYPPQQPPPNDQNPYAPPQNNQMNPYQHMQQPMEQLPTDGRAITSLVLGIVSIVLGCLPLVGIICGTIAIILFIKVNSDFNERQGQLKGKGLAIAGLVTGIIGVLIGLFYTVYWFFVGAVFSSLGTLNNLN